MLKLVGRVESWHPKVALRFVSNKLFSAQPHVSYCTPINPPRHPPALPMCLNIASILLIYTFSGIWRTKRIGPYKIRKVQYRIAPCPLPLVPVPQQHIRRRLVVLSVIPAPLITPTTMGHFPHHRSASGRQWGWGGGRPVKTGVYRFNFWMLRSSRGFLMHQPWRTVKRSSETSTTTMTATTKQTSSVQYCYSSVAFTFS